MAEFFSIVSTTLRDISFWTGFFTLFLFATGRFNEKQQDDLDLDPPLPNRCFTTQFRYRSTSLIYALIHLAVYAALVIAGSIPSLQEPLMDLFGSVGSDEAAIGTPAWAAMVIMVIAPNMSRVNKMDTKLRKWLLRFAGIPYKARQIADELVVALRPTVPGQRFIPLRERPIDEIVTLFTDLTLLRRKLEADGGTLGEFFDVHASVVDALDQRFDAVRKSYAAFQGTNPAHSQTDAATFCTQFADLVRRHARLVACAILYSEADEFRARNILRMQYEVANLDSGSFRFGKGQAVIGALTVFAVSVIFGPATIAIRDNSDFDAWFFSLRVWSIWGAAAAAAFLLSLVLAAAVQFWLIDEDSRGVSRDWIAKFNILFTTFIGCFALAGLPMFLGSVVSGIYTSYNPLLTAYAVIPAIVGVLFIAISRQRSDVSTLRNAVLDGCIFGLAGAAATYGVGAVLEGIELSKTNGANFSDYGRILATELPPVALVSLLVSGAFGALQCNASRHYLGEIRKHQESFALMINPLRTNP